MLLTVILVCYFFYLIVSYDSYWLFLMLCLAGIVYITLEVLLSVLISIVLLILEKFCGRLHGDV